MKDEVNFGKYRVRNKVSLLKMQVATAFLKDLFLPAQQLKLLLLLLVKQRWITKMRFGRVNRDIFAKKPFIHFISRGWKRKSQLASQSLTHDNKIYESNFLLLG